MASGMLVSVSLECGVWLKLYGCRRKSVPGDINEQNAVDVGCGWVRVVVGFSGIVCYNNYFLNVGCVEGGCGFLFL